MLDLTPALRLTPIAIRPLIDESGPPLRVRGPQADDRERARSCSGLDDRMLPNADGRGQQNAVVESTALIRPLSRRRGSAEAEPAHSVNS